MIDNIRRNWIIYLVLVVVTVAVYARVTQFHFINYDDHGYVTDNPGVKQGINPRSLSWAFTTRYESNWMPLVWISFMFDHMTGGSVPHPDSNHGTENPAPYHRTNLILHVLNTLLLFALLNALTGLRWRSAFVAALFAVHPMHVQSVAWVAERKDVLSTFFMFLALLAYARYARKPSVGKYLLVAAALALGLMSKSMLVTVPILLLLLDFWPLRRTAGAKHSQSDQTICASPSANASPLRLILEKVPLLMMAVAVGVVTVIFQQHAHSVGTLKAYPPTVRLGNAIFSYVSYVVKMFWPTKLAFFYPHPGRSIPTWQVSGSLLLLVMMTIAARKLARRAPYVIVGWLWYLISLLPVIGIVQVGDQAMADRYTYVPYIGLFVIIAWGIPDLLNGLGERAASARRIALGIGAGAAVLILATLAYGEVSYWRNDETIFGRALKVTRNNTLAHHNLATALTYEGKLTQAVRHYEAIIRIDPKDFAAHSRLAALLDQLGQTRRAATEYMITLRLRSVDWEAANNLAMILSTDKDPKLHDPRSAVQAAELADAVTRHTRPDVLDTLAVAYASAGRYDMAVSTARKGVALAEAAHDSATAREIARKIPGFVSHKPSMP